MFCPKCGAEQLNENARFCGRCGEPLAPDAPEQQQAAPIQTQPEWFTSTTQQAQPNQAPTPAQPPQASAVSAPPQPSTSKNPPKKIGLIVGGAVAAVALILVVALVIMPKVVHKPFVGTWVAVSEVSHGGAPTSFEEYSKQPGFYSLKINDDGTGTFTYFNMSYDFTWNKIDDTHARMSVTVETEVSEWGLELSDNKLTMYYENTDTLTTLVPESEVDNYFATNSQS